MTLFERTDSDPILIQIQDVPVGPNITEERLLIFPGKPPCVGIKLTREEAVALLKELDAWYWSTADIRDDSKGWPDL